MLTATINVRFRWDTVEKVENRTTLKISQKLIFGQLRRQDGP
jgi:hypothetical protein